MPAPDDTPAPDLRTRLLTAAAGEGEGLRRGLWVSFLNPYGLEVVVGSGVDWVGLDLQHGDLEPTDVPGLLRVVEHARLPVLARTPSHDAATIGRLLDAGVDGLIVPMVETADQARALVSACRTPPHGTRSTGGCRQALGVTRAPAQQLLLPMVETATGLKRAADILAVPGIDGVFVGPYDLSISAGYPEPDSAQTVQALRHVVGLARGAGKVVGFMAGRPALLEVAPEADLVAVDTDVTALRLGLSRLFARPRSRGTPS
ncbi:HpcH/HpaI aldolase family protein [Ornithinimicrobium sp. W1665]|uniref:HpcH/HpaI aldolase family protein n=1 Tax=Ornithinimicrobium sp. W1665 TaxID=3416666 RepID=UPI003CFAF136